MSSSSDVSWSDLPFEIITSIAERIPTFPMAELKHLLLFGSVCKTWRQASLNVRFRRHLSMPCLIDVVHAVLNNGTLPAMRCVLSDFWSEQTHLFAKVMAEPLQLTLIHASCNGWLLISGHSNELRDQNMQLIRFFFYNPFLDIRIALPNLVVEVGKIIYVSRFTAAPTSEDCNIFITYARSAGSDLICRIYTCNLKDKKWIYQNIPPHDKHLRDVLYLNGAFYCVCSVGFSVVMNIFTFRSDYSADQAGPNDGPFIASPYSSSLQITETDLLYLAEADEEILLAIYSRDKSNKTNSCCHIYQFDRSEKEWSPVKNLGNRVLILSCKSNIGAILVPAVQDAEQFANMILVLKRSTYDSYICEDSEGTWRFDKMHDLNKLGKSYFRIEPPPLWR